MSVKIKTVGCPFCSTLKACKEKDEYFRREGYHEQYTVALVSRSYYGEEPCSRTTYHFNELNVCPVCGTKIEKENEI